MTLRSPTQPVQSRLTQLSSTHLLGFHRSTQLLMAAGTAVALSLSLSTAVSAQQIDSAQTDIQTVIAQSATPQSPGAIAPPAAPTPAPTPFDPLLGGITDLLEGAGSINSVGHLRPRDVGGVEAANASWLQSAIVPLYVSPGGDHWGWIYQGWLIPQGQTYLAIGRDAGFAMVRPSDDLYTFPLLEIRDDGWVRLQYTEGGSAWVHTSQLELGDVPLTVESWGEHLAGQDTVAFLDATKAQPLRSQPESANNMLSLVAADSLIEPTVIQGDWMLVKVTRPTAECVPLTGATVTEGWMRWRGDSGEALAWGRSGRDCQQQTAEVTTADPEPAVPEATTTAEPDPVTAESDAVSESSGGGGSESVSSDSVVSGQ
ncbi:MAG: hypothetical protein AAFO06_19110 [Cyanobacteria bacterium J06597_16]